MTQALAGIHLAVTRPSAQAAQLTQAIRDAGGEVISFPLLDIVALDDITACVEAITPLSRFDWVIFISSNAVQHGMPVLQKQGIPERLKFAAIGPATAQALHDFSIASVLTPQDRYDSESLLALPAMQTMQGQSVLIVRGVGGRELLATRLQQRGAQVTFCECYRRINPQATAAPLQQAWVQGRLHGLIVTSSEALRHLLSLTSASDWLKQLPLFVNHARIAEQATAAGLQAVVAETPGDEGMFEQLSRHFHSSI